MSRVRIWAVESDYDEKAVKTLATKLVQTLHLQVDIVSAGKTAYTGVAQKSQGLEKAVESYLKKDNYLIFVLDTDSSRDLKEQRQRKNSHVSRIEQLVKADKYIGKVYMALAIHELEAWLLVDCVGIACYFAQTRYKQDCRKRIIETPQLKNVITKYQKSNTETIMGDVTGAGAKEHLVKFSEEVLKVLTPKAQPKDIDQNRYTESFSPDVATFVEINQETLKRNPSLRRLGELLTQCC